MSRPKILVADDDRLTLTLLCKGLRDAGYSVFSAADGESAVALGSEQRPDLAVLDIRMPGMLGIEVARQLRERVNVPSIFLTAYADKQIVELAIQQGALGYLVKPLSAAQLIPAIEAALLRSTELQQLQESTASLTGALNSNREISVAIGIYMERYQVSQQTAVDTLREYARSEQRKLLDVARELIASKHQQTGLINQLSPL